MRFHLLRFAVAKSIWDVPCEKECVVIPIISSASVSPTCFLLFTARYFCETFSVLNTSCYSQYTRHANKRKSIWFFPSFSLSLYLFHHRRFSSLLTFTTLFSLIFCCFCFSRSDRKPCAYCFWNLRSFSKSKTRKKNRVSRINAREHRIPTFQGIYLLIVVFSFYVQSI